MPSVAMLSEAGLVADDAAERRRADHRTVGLRADRGRHHAARDGGGRARGRSAGRVPRVPRVARLRRHHERELGADRLAERERTGAFEVVHERRRARRHVARPRRVAHAGRHAGDVDDVLHADRHAVQAATLGRCEQVGRIVARTLRRVRRTIGSAGGLECAIGVEPLPRAHLGFQRIDAFEAARDERLRGAVSPADRAGRLGEAEREQWLHRGVLLGRRDSPAIDGVACADRCDRCRVSRARAPSIPD